MLIVAKDNEDKFINSKKLPKNTQKQLKEVFETLANDNELLKKIYKKVVLQKTKNQEIAKFYDTHNIYATQNKYGLSLQEISNLYKKVTGKSKTEKYKYPDKEVAQYYLNHTYKETMQKFKNLGASTMATKFYKQYGMSRKEYLKQHNLK